MLRLKDIKGVFPQSSGINDEEMEFHSVSIDESNCGKRCLFVSLGEEHSLKEALENGAIAAIIKEGEAIPAYTPNHFPVFRAVEPMAAFFDILQNYINKNRKKEWEDMTKFIFYRTKLLNDSTITYDIAVEIDRTALVDAVQSHVSARRG
ncbi:hypothetical protein [Falsibacillus pallidus]|uniref:hypothetical protein n=1 Tax=Falsibacillus pallidus TaxID=493781 RepID=UPI003D9943AF